MDKLVISNIKLKIQVDKLMERIKNKPLVNNYKLYAESSSGLKDLGVVAFSYKDLSFCRNIGLHIKMFDNEDNEIDIDEDCLIDLVVI